MIVKSVTAGLAALVALGTAGTLGTVSATAPGQVGLAVFGTPLPADQADGLPTVNQLTDVLIVLADPVVPFADKGGLVEGGIPPIEAAMADHGLQKAAKKGQLPLVFGVANILPAGPGAANADVTVSGPKLAPRTMTVNFVDQGNWMLSSDSAMQLLQAASGK